MSQLHIGPIILELDPDDETMFGWDPEHEQVRLTTRTQAHRKARRGSLVSVEMSVDQLRLMLRTGVELLRMIDTGRTPGDRPYLPPDSPLIEEEPLDAPPPKQRYDA